MLSSYTDTGSVPVYLVFPDRGDPHSELLSIDFHMTQTQHGEPCGGQVVWGGWGWGR